ncbi:MAG TPA: hypothetical protein VFW33_19535 [Gemmataceae bacterium]|nr:hypothetical protein [Gemmataceae bacterium]
MLAINARLKIDPDKIVKELESRAWEGIQRATVFLHSKVKEALNVPNSGERRKHPARKTPSGRAASYTVYPHPSRPGEPPRKRTGWLQSQVAYDLDRTRLQGRVGVRVSARYGLYLELGTRRMQARPFITAPIVQYRAQLDALIRSGRG